jgi:hypothetical protein|tara:strand:+ start:1607 stop:3442 length:1836 start_codon:yes stop_codon:yes gene_type:complete
MVTTIRSTDLDFTSIKTSLKTSLQNNPEFKDYNFEGSGLSALLDVLAYNTHYNALIANMALNESYLTTAQLRSSVVSLAEAIGYIPSSKTAPSATVNLSINTGNLAGRPTFISLPRGTKFTTIVDNVSYTFETIGSVTAEDNGNGLYIFKNDRGSENITIREGKNITKTFIVSENSPDSVYIIPDKNMDTTTAFVSVYPDMSSTTFITYTDLKEADTIDDQSKVYILRETPNEFYELSFGDGFTLGKAPEAGNKIVVEYLSTSGPDANGATNFTPVTQVPISSAGGNVNFTISLTTVTKAVSGSVVESVASIRKNAPFSYASQNRMVTAADYATLIKRNFGYLIKDIQAYGGEDAVRKEYGVVFLSIVFKDDVTQETIDKTKGDIENLARQLQVITFDVKFQDPDITYLEASVFFQFNPKFTSSSIQEIQSRVEVAADNYFADNTGLFEQSYRRSNLLALVDEVDPSVLSSRANLKVQKRYVPFLGRLESATLRYASPIAEPNDEEPTITSTGFFSNGVRVRIENKLDTYKLQLVALDDNTVLVDNIGEYFPATGIVSIVGLTVDSIIGGNDFIKISGVAANESFSSPGQNQIVVYDEGPSFVQANIVKTS